MADTNVQLPPSSTGQKMRVETGDASNLIPAGVGEEVVILSDQQGFMPGDQRMAMLPVLVTQLEETNMLLRQLLLTIAVIANVQPVSASDAATLD